VGETLRHALNNLAVVVPQWVANALSSGVGGTLWAACGDYRLPASKAERGAEAERIGRDGHALLAALYAVDALPWLREIPAVETLRQGVGATVLSDRGDGAVAVNGRTWHSSAHLFMRPSKSGEVSFWGEYITGSTFPRVKELP